MITSLPLVFLAHRESIDTHWMIYIYNFSLYTSWFYENWGSYQFLKRDDDGVLIYDPTVPSDVPFVCVSGKDCGVLAGVALKNPEKYIGWCQSISLGPCSEPYPKGKDINAATALLSPRQMVPVLEEIVGEKVRLKEMTMEEFDNAKDTMWPEAWLGFKVCVCAFEPMRH